MNSIESLKKFYFSIGGYFASNYEIVVKGNKAKYRASMHILEFAKRHEKEISQDQIDLFLSKLNQLNIIQWEKEYLSDSLDGVQWELELVYNQEARKKIYGSNSYPNSEPDSDETSPEFEELLNAIKELINEPLFFSDEFISGEEN